MKYLDMEICKEAIQGVICLELPVSFSCIFGIVFNLIAFRMAKTIEVMEESIYEKKMLR